MNFNGPSLLLLHRRATRALALFSPAVASSIFVVSLLMGCSGGPSAQLQQVQVEKEQLLTALRQERESAQAAKARLATVEQRLDEAEKQLAMSGSRPVTSTASTRSSSSRPSTTSPSTPSSRSGVMQPLPTSTPSKTPSKPIGEPLPWRPADKTPIRPPAKADSGVRQSSYDYEAPTEPSILYAVSQRDRRLRFDDASRSAIVEMPVLFDAGTAILTSEGRESLDQLAKLLRTDPLKQTKVLVAGVASGRPSQLPGQQTTARYSSARALGTARAQAVADYLDRHGVAENRLAVTGSGDRGTAPLAKIEQPGTQVGGVEIHLLDSETSVVGWSQEGGLERR